MHLCVCVYIFIYIHTVFIYVCICVCVEKSIESPSSNERFDYFSNLEVPFFSSKEGGGPVLLSI